MFSTVFTSLSVSLLFALSITFFIIVQFFILFHLTQMRFSESIHLLFLSMETLRSIIRTGLSILVELIKLVSSVIIFLSQMTLLRCLTLLLGSHCYSHSPALLFLLTLVFVLQQLSLHWEILIILLSQFPLTFHQIHNGIPISSRSR